MHCSFSSSNGTFAAIVMHGHGNSQPCARTGTRGARTHAAHCVSSGRRSSSTTGASDRQRGPRQLISQRTNGSNNVKAVFARNGIASNRVETSRWRPNILSCARHVIREHRCSANAYGQRRITGSPACKALAHCLYGSLWTNRDLHHDIFLAAAWCPTWPAQACAQYVLSRLNVREDNGQKQKPW